MAILKIFSLLFRMQRKRKRVMETERVRGNGRGRRGKSGIRLNITCLKECWCIMHTKTTTKCVRSASFVFIKVMKMIDLVLCFSCRISSQFPSSIYIFLEMCQLLSVWVYLLLSMAQSLVELKIVHLNETPTKFLDYEYCSVLNSLSRADF